MVETENTLDYESNYHKKRHNALFNDVYYEARAKIALRKFFNTLNGNEKFLDYGCGMGQNIFLLPKAKGFDISEFALEHCRNKGSDVTNNLDDLPDEHFDVVFTSHVLEHHENPKEMIEIMKSKLAPGGKLLLVIPHERHGKSDFEVDLNQHLFSWNFRTINNLLMISGFKILSNRYVRGAGYEKLLFLYKINFGLYQAFTNLLSRLYGIKEIMVIAQKT